MTEEVTEGLFEEVAFEPKREEWEALAVGRVSRSKGCRPGRGGTGGAMALSQEQASFVWEQGGGRCGWRDEGE